MRGNVRKDAAAANSVRKILRPSPREAGAAVGGARFYADYGL